MPCARPPLPASRDPARTVIAGINYPWSVVNGVPNYGCDFGRNIWSSHTGVSTHLDEVRVEFSEMSAMGTEVVRWFVFTDGRGGVRWGTDGRLEGLGLGDGRPRAAPGP